jgi:hypothetical protein
MIKTQTLEFVQRAAIVAEVVYVLAYRSQMEMIIL